MSESVLSTGDFAALLRATREAHGLTVSEFHRRVVASGVRRSLRAIYDAESGSRLTSITIVKAYADQFNRPDLLAIRGELVRASGRSRVNPRAEIRALLGQDRQTAVVDEEPSETPHLCDANAGPCTQTLAFATTSASAWNLAVSAMEHVAARAPNLGDAIITTIPFSLPEGAGEDLARRWRVAFQSALDARWNIICLFAPPAAALDRSTLVADSLILSSDQRGFFEARVVNRGLDRCTVDYLAIPGSGVVEMTASSSTGVVDTAAFFPMGGDDEYAASLYAFVSRLADGADRVGAAYCRPPGVQARPPERQWSRFLSRAALAEHSDGPRLAARRLMPSFTAPPKVHAGLVATANAVWQSDADELRAFLELAEARRSAYAKVRVHREIYPTESIRNYLEGNTGDDYRSYFDLPSSCKRQARDHVGFLVSMLKSNDSFELALVSTEEFDSLFPADVAILQSIDGPSHVLVESCRRVDCHGREYEADLVVTDPWVTRAVADYFDGVWAALPPSSKDRTAVAERLELLLDQTLETFDLEDL